VTHSIDIMKTMSPLPRPNQQLSPKIYLLSGSIISAVVACLIGFSSLPVTLLLLLCVVLFLTWTLIDRPSVIPMAILVAISVIAIGWLGGTQEPIIFQSIIAAAAIAWQVDSVRLSVMLGLFLVLVPVIATFGLAGWWNWSVGTMLMWMLGRLLHNLEAVKDELSQAQRELLAAAARDERRRIAREVHDLVGHSLTAMLLHVRGAQQMLNVDNAECRKALADAETIGRTGLADVRASVNVLWDASDSSDSDNPIAPPDGDSIVSLLDRQQGIQKTVNGPVQSLRGPIALAVCRVLQESLTNATKHGVAGTISVDLDVTEAKVNLIVENTVADTTYRRAEANRMGLVGMRERIHVLGGIFAANAAGNRWCLECEIPR